MTTHMQNPLKSECLETLALGIGPQTHVIDLILVITSQ